MNLYQIVFLLLFVGSAYRYITWLFPVFPRTISVIYICFALMIAHFMSVWVELDSYWAAFTQEFWTLLLFYVVLTPIGGIAFIIDSVKSKEKPNA
jgi:hypothetical protein